MSDSRAEDYVMKYGRQSWELDALEPKVISELIKNEVEGLINWEDWEDTRTEEQERRSELAKLYDNWDEIAVFLKDTF
jgi:hypothetical protein